MTEFKKRWLKKAKSLLEKEDRDFMRQFPKLIGEPIEKEQIFNEYPKLEELYDNIGNNPEDEKKLSCDWDDITKKYFSSLYLEKIAKVKEFDFSEIGYEYRKQFASLVAIKIISYVDDDTGAYKYIEKFQDIDFKAIQDRDTEIMKLYKQVDESIEPIRSEMNEGLEKMLNGYDQDIDDAKEFEFKKKLLIRNYESKMEEIEKEYETKISNLLFKITKAKKTDMSDWERKLFQLNALAMLGLTNKQPFVKEQL